MALILDHRIKQQWGWVSGIIEKQVPGLVPGTKAGRNLRHLARKVDNVVADKTKEASILPSQLMLAPC